MRAILIKKLKLDSENLIFFSIMVILSTLFLIKSPLHPWIGGETQTDSSVFKTIAMMMQKGKMPYKDSFDHKGPLLYVINYWGNVISEYRGIWVIELVVLAVTFFTIYKIARLFCKEKSAFIVTLLTTSLLSIDYAGGNLTEEYAMPCVAISLFIFIDFIKNGIVTYWRLFILGVGLGITLLLRANMISVWIVFCVALTVKFIIKREFKKLLRYILCFTSGLLAVSVPIIMWLYCNGALELFWKDYIVFNIKYCEVSFLDKWNAFFFFLGEDIIVISLVCLLGIFCEKDNKELNRMYLVYMILSIILVSMSGKPRGHYGMVIIPAVVYPISYVLGMIEKIEVPKVPTILWTCVVGCLLIIYIYPNWSEIIRQTPEFYKNRGIEYKSEVITTLESIVDEYSSEEDTISVYGNWDIIYVLTHRTHATQYSYQSPIGTVMPEIMEDYMKQMKNEQPAIVIVQKGHWDDNIKQFLQENDYELIWTESEKMSEGALAFHKSELYG